MKIWPVVVLAVVVFFVAVLLLWDVPLFRKRSPRTELLIKAIDNITKRPNELEPWIENFIETLPNITLPVKGICEDGEAVEDVLKRLEKEGDANKIERFKRYMASTISLRDSVLVFLKSQGKTQNQMMAEAMNSILSGKNEPWVKSFTKYIPKFTFPIEGICKDGELVDDVLKRLEEEGNKDKIAYFRKYMKSGCVKDDSFCSKKQKLAEKFSLITAQRFPGLSSRETTNQPSAADPSMSYPFLCISAISSFDHSALAILHPLWQKCSSAPIIHWKSDICVVVAFHRCIESFF